MVKLFKSENSVEMRKYDYLRVIARLNVRKIHFHLSEEDFESPRQTRYYWNRLSTKLKSINRKDYPFLDTFNSYVIDSPVDNSIILKVFELSIGFYDNDKNFIYEHCPGTVILDSLLNDWEFCKGNPINKSKVAIHTTDSKTMVIADYFEINKTPHTVIENYDFEASANKLIDCEDYPTYGIKHLNENIMIANMGFDKRAKFERSTIMAMRLELNPKAFDFSKPIKDLHADAIKEFTRFADFYDISLFSGLSYINTEMSVFNPAIIIHYVNLEKCIENNNEININKLLSDVVSNSSNNDDSVFTVSKLLFDQELDIFISEGNHIENKRKFEITKKNGEYILTKDEDMIYPNPRSIIDPIHDRNEYIKAVVESSVTGIDEYIEYFANTKEDSSNKKSIDNVIAKDEE